MRSLLGVPLGGRPGVLGNLYLTEKNGGESFTDEDEDLAILLAAKAAAAIENARHHEESAAPGGSAAAPAPAERFFAMVNHELRK
jgi:GAF domain-containing protein